MREYVVWSTYDETVIHCSRNLCMSSVFMLVGLSPRVKQACKLIFRQNNFDRINEISRYVGNSSYCSQVF